MNRYNAPLYVDIEKHTYMVNSDGTEDETDSELKPKVLIGKVPIMLRSQYCMLSETTDKDLTELGECIYDQVNYISLQFV